MTLGESCTTPAFLRSRAARHSDALCIAKGEERLTYAGLEEGSRRLARGLLAEGVGKGTRIGLLMPNGPAWVTAWMAVTRIGAVLIPLNTFYQARELGWVLRHADVDTLLCVDRFLRNDYLARLEQAAPGLDSTSHPPLRVRALPFLRRVYVAGKGERRWTRPLARLEERADEIADALLEEVEREVTPADAMVVIYSSGSTADPKGAIHTHGSLLRHAHNLNRFRDLEPGDRMYSPMPFFWVGGFVFTLLCSMDVGAALICEDVFEPGATLDLIEREGVTVVAGWPHYSKALAEHPSFARRDLSRVRGGNLYDLLPQDQRPREPELRSNSLGMTETGGPHSIERMDEELPEHLRGAFGRAVPGLEHRIVDPETGAPLPPGEPGEICVRGYSLLQGLHKREREEVFDREGFYHTGDGGHLDEEGWLFFRGRLGDMIKTAGANVSPREVESVAMELPEVREAHVVGLPHPDRGENVAAAIVLRDGARIDAAALRAALRKQLSAYKVPRHLWFLASVPMTDSGKVDKKRLRAELLGRLERGDDGMS